MYSLFSILLLPLSQVQIVSTPCSNIPVTVMTTSYLKMGVWGCIRKFLDWVDNEINNSSSSSNKHTFRSNIKGYGSKLIRLTHEIVIQLHLVAESCIIEVLTLLNNITVMNGISHITCLLKITLLTTSCETLYKQSFLIIQVICSTTVTQLHPCHTCSLSYFLWFISWKGLRMKNNAILSCIVGMVQ